MTEPQARAWWKTPILPAMLIAAYAIVAGYTHDLLVDLCLVGLFFIVVLPLIVVICVSFFRESKTHSRRRRHYFAIAIVLASPLLTYLTAQGRYNLGFLAWAPFHRDVLNRNEGTDGIVAVWDSWGWLGWFNDAYLIRDSTGALASIDQAEAWRKRRGLLCEIVKTERVWSKLYIVITRDCSFDFDESGS